MSAEEKNQGKRHTGRLELRGKKWLALYMINGKRYAKSTGCEDRKAAQEWLDKQLDSYRTQDALRSAKKDEDMIRQTMKNLLGSALTENEQRQKDLRGGMLKITFQNAWAAFDKHPNRKRVVPATLEHTRKAFENLATWMNESHPEVQEIRDLDEDMALEYAAHIRDLYVPSTFNNVISELQHIWTLLGRKAKTRTNPWTRQNVTRQSAVGSSIRREITDTELLVIFREARDYRPPLERLFTVLLYTGARLSDAAQLRWESIDLRRGFISFIPQKTKRYGEASRVKIPIMPPLRAMLEATPAEDRKGYVMPDMASEYQAHHLNNIVTRFFHSRCGIETRRKTGIGNKAHSEVSAHSFRHKFVSLAANAGIPFAIVQRIVGHQTATMCEHYFHENEAATLQAFKAFPTLTANAPQIEDKDGEVIDVEATVTGPTRVDELKRLLGEIVAGGDADELEAARAAMKEVMK